VSAIENTKEPEAAFEPLSILELTTLLIKHYDVHEGIYTPLIEFQIGVGAVGPRPESQYPGAMIGVAKVGLAKAKTLGPSTVDAAEANPRKKKPKKQA
jgi:hypothetical protein